MDYLEVVANSRQKLSNVSNVKSKMHSDFLFWQNFPKTWKQGISILLVKGEIPTVEKSFK
jgi:hypothetical protein